MWASDKADIDWGTLSLVKMDAKLYKSLVDWDGFSTNQWVENKVITGDEKSPLVTELRAIADAKDASAIAKLCRTIPVRTMTARSWSWWGSIFKQELRDAYAADHSLLVR